MTVIIILVALISVAVIFLFSKYDTYVIPKGQHYSVHAPRLFNKQYKGFTVAFEFDKSAIYDLKSEDQKDINKLFGIAYESVHKCSTRVGWRWNIEENAIELFDYRYTAGIRSYSLIKRIPFTGNIAAGEVTLSMNEAQLKPVMITHLLFPYFGGNRTAPHTIKIKIRYKLFE